MNILDKTEIDEKALAYMKSRWLKLLGFIKAGPVAMGLYTGLVAALFYGLGSIK